MQRGRRHKQLLITVALVLVSASFSKSQITYPFFINSPYTASIREDASRTARVLDGIHVNDTQSNAALIDVACDQAQSTTDACSLFALTATKQDNIEWYGYMTLAGTLDYEVKGSRYNISLLAQERGTGKTNHGTVIVNVIDVQNKPPIFQPPYDVFGVPETTTPGTKITTYSATDGDATNKRNVQYSLTGNPFGLFAIDPTTGVLTNTGPMQFSDSRWISGYLTVQVTATELTSSGVPATDALSRTTIDSRINLADANNYAPTFDKTSYAAAIDERSPAGTAVPGLTIVVSDRDRSPINSQFDLTMDRSTNVFQVVPSNGTGSVSAQIIVLDSALINYDTGPRQFIFTLTARESRTTERKSATAQVNITLNGVNNYEPVFNPKSVNVSISELAKGGEPVATLTATDQDYGFYGTEGIWYKIRPGIVGYTLFKCNTTTGAVTVAPCATPGRLSCIDYERTKSYALQIIAVDSYGEGKSSTGTIFVSIINENDNPPAFSKSEYVSDINEGSQVLKDPIFINATDDYNNNIAFSITSGNINNIWRIDPNTKELLSNKAINYDDTPKNSQGNSQGFFLLTINGTNSYATTTATARITVVPVNRYSPVFDQNYNVSIPDNKAAGSTVVTIHATDNDSSSTPNGIIRYRLVSGTGDDFVVDPITGDVTVAHGASLNQPFYNITIEAADQGSPQRTSTGILTIYITPTSFAPQFQSNPTRLFTLENAPIGTILGSSNVTDPDRDAILVYDIIDPIIASNGNGIPVLLNSTDRTMFAINRTTGMIYVNQPLEFDHINLWQAILRVVDQGPSSSPSAATSTATLIVRIWSVNDKPPQFNYPWTPQNPNISISRSQDTQPDTPIGTITANSPNDTLVIKYKLIDDYNGAFTVNDTTGQVTVNRVLSYANDSNAKFVIVATDNGEPSQSSTATVYINIQNTNAHAPQFSESSYYAEIPENSPGGTFVVKVLATDLDVGEFGTISYEFPFPNNQFVIDSVTGVITVANGAVLDRETQPQIAFAVVAYDSPDVVYRRSITADVLVNLTDMNDNRPLFDRSIYIATIPADIPMNTTISKVTANDPDLGNNGTVRYSIIGGNTNNIFQIDPVTGEITPARSLLTSSGSYQLTVFATDLGTPVPLNNTVQVVINVQPAAHLPPVWYIPAADNTIIYLDEGLPVDTYVTTVYANSTNGGGITYYLQYLNNPVDQTVDFRIQNKSGVLTTNQVFNYELKNSYLVTLIAVNDFGDKSTRYLNVYIKKVDTVNPKFPENNSTCCAKPYTFTVDKASPQGSIFGEVKAYLPNPYRDIYYRVLPNDNDVDADITFGVVRETGQMIVNGSLGPLQVNRTYHMVIEAFHKDPPHPFINLVPPCLCNNQSRVDVYITVVDLTERVPRFSVSEYKICVSEDKEIGSSVFQCNNTNYSPDRPVNYTAVSLTKYGGGGNPNVYDITNLPSLPFLMPPPNGTIFTNDVMKNHLGSYFTQQVSAYFFGNSPRYDAAQFAVTMYVVQLKDEVLVTVNENVDRVWANIEQYKQWIAAHINNGVICIEEVRHHISPAGGVNTLMTDILFYAIDGSNNQVVHPLDLDKRFNISARIPYNIIGITEANTYWDGFNYIPVAAAIGIIIGLIVLALILFLCCCCCWSWLLKSARYTEKEPLIYNAGTLGAVNPVWNQKMFESQSLSMAVAEGDGMDKTIALHGAYNGYDAGDGDVFGDGTSRLNLQTSGSQSGLSAITQPGLVHIEAPLSDGQGGASASTHQETTMTVESALAPEPIIAATSVGAVGGAPPPSGPSAGGATGGGTGGSELNGMGYSNMPYTNQTTTERKTTTTTSQSQMVHGYSTGTMTDEDDDDGGRGTGTVTRAQGQSSYDAPIVDLTGPAGRGPTKIGATLYQPFGITGEQRPQSVISGRETYMNEEDYRGTMAGGHRDGSRSAMSSLPLQKEIVFNDLRPESMYDYGYENAGGYQRDSDGGAYQGEIRLGTMREARGSSSDQFHETRYL